MVQHCLMLVIHPSHQLISTSNWQEILQNSHLIGFQPCFLLLCMVPFIYCALISGILLGILVNLGPGVLHSELWPTSLSLHIFLCTGTWRPRYGTPEIPLNWSISKDSTTGVWATGWTPTSLCRTGPSSRKLLSLTEMTSVNKYFFYLWQF